MIKDIKILPKYLHLNSLPYFIIDVRCSHPRHHGKAPYKSIIFMVPFLLVAGGTKLPSKKASVIPQILLLGGSCKDTFLTQVYFQTSPPTFAVQKEEKAPSLLTSH